VSIRLIYSVRNVLVIDFLFSDFTRIQCVILIASSVVDLGVQRYKMGRDSCYVLNSVLIDGGLIEDIN